MKLLLTSLISASCLSGLAGCAADAGQDSADRVHRRSDALAIAIPQDSDLSVPTEGRVTFTVVANPDDPSRSIWEERVEAPLFGGGKVNLTVTRERFPKCGIGGTVTAFVRTAAGTREWTLDQGDSELYRSAVIEIPVGVDQAELWLRSTSSGCEEWDSDFERNYAFDVFNWSPTLLSFDAQWNETETALEAGGAAVLDYDFARLPDCRVSYHGHPSWDVLVHARFDDGTMLKQSMVQLGYTGQGVPDGTVKANRVVIPVPRKASLVEFWFENTQYPPTCQAWDSDYEKNYHYAITPAGSKPGPEGKVACANGSLVVSCDADLLCTATVTDQSAIDYFATKSHETHQQEVSMYGGGTATVTLQSYMPYNMTIEGEGSARKLVVTELRPSLAGGFSAGQYLANLDAAESGLKLSVTNLEMLNSHTATSWQMGSWTFSGCAAK